MLQQVSESTKQCTNPEHRPIPREVYPPGSYRHTCPECGYLVTWTVQERILNVTDAPSWMDMPH